MNCEGCCFMAECEREKMRLLGKGIMLGCMYESDNGVQYGRKGEVDGSNQQKTREADIGNEKKMEGNNMKAREALEFIKLASDDYEQYGNTKAGALDVIYEKACSALSAPARNCDVGTAEEQAKRMDAYCASHGERIGCSWRCDTCPLCKIDRCELAWAQMPYEAERKGEGNGGNQTKTREAPGAPIIKPCICRGIPVCETRRTEYANSLIMPLVEHRVRCDVCGRATNWYEDDAKAEAEWNAVAGSYDECNQQY